jgi:hypothetical protein
MVICHTNSGQTKIDHFKFRVELVKALILNIKMRVSGNFKAILPQTKMCRALLKDIFQKEYHTTDRKKRPGQQRGV